MSTQAVVPAAEPAVESKEQGTRSGTLHCGDLRSIRGPH